MEPTHLKRRDTSVLPVPAETVQPEAYQRAPTLMAGESAGMQGTVRVWVPHRRLILSSITGSLAYFLLALYHSWYWRVGDYYGAVVYLMIAIVLAVPVIRNFLRPCYISTDEAGIAVTTRKGAHAFRWSEILSVEDENRKSGHYIDLVIEGARLRIDLIGYPKRVQNELVELIESHVKPPLHSAFWTRQASLSSPQLRACRGMKEPD